MFCGRRPGRSLLCTNNENLAHKKNVGEEARLLGDLHLIHRRMILSTSSMNVEKKNIYYDLKGVRTSTGHSMEALPPTPFRLHRQNHAQKRVSFQMSRNHSISPTEQFLPAVHYQKQHQSYPHYLDNHSNLRENDKGNVKPDLNWNVSVHQSSKIPYMPKTELTSTLSLDSVFPEAVHRIQQTKMSQTSLHPHADTKIGELEARRVSVEFTLHDLKRSYTEGAADFGKRTTGSHRLRRGNERSDGMDNNDFAAVLKDRSKTESIIPIAEERNEPESDRPIATSCITPLARELTEMIEAVRKKNSELLAVKAAVVSINSKTKDHERREQQKALDQLRLHKARQGRCQVNKLPNARYQCRTCVERLRDNARYRQSLSYDAGCSSESNSKGSGATCRYRRKADKLPSFPIKDLDGNVISPQEKTETSRGKCRSDSDRRAQQEDETTTETVTEQHANNREGHADRVEKCRKPGYSRARMQQLAEPKGRSKFLKVSGRVLQRQAEVLRHPHENKQMTEREQERLLRLQSRVRLFLALLQERQMPHAMVHIPQRDDIMHVDISHIG